MINVFDCSNSVERPHHRRGDGPKENDTLRYLREHAHLYNCQWVDTASAADIIITNDVFPEDCLRLDVPLVKRMDGVFWQNRLKERNEPFNMAAQQADHVIFISEFSKQSYFDLYGDSPIKNCSVVLNAVDTSVFHKKEIPISDRFSTIFGKFTFVAIATDWSREEKRLGCILRLAELTNTAVVLIGKCPKGLPENIYSYGYLSDHGETATILNRADAYLNLSYRDAAPKVVAQGINCGLPVLYANSGGVPELVSSFGIPVPDRSENVFSNTTPDLSPIALVRAYEKLRRSYALLCKEDANQSFRDMLEGYFEILGDTWET